jgi:nicotinate phosphoribosyltransferase
LNWVSDSNAALLTDLYELTMAASYHSRDMTAEATFDLFVRELPRERNFLISCGLEQALDYLENLRFEDESITYLRSLDMFNEGFLNYLETLRFTGSVHAIAEGDLVFPGEPLLRVTAPLIEAQVVETFLLNCVIFQTMIASKAARVQIACGDQTTFVDISLRRDHGADAALKAAPASYVGGASATSNVLAGKLWGIPVSGTMAHSYIMAFEDELAAFRSFARDFPDRAVLLIDTFDVEEGARRAAQVARELAEEGVALAGVRIDSGDLAELSRSVRKILDDAGLKETKIFLSGDLDEYRIKALRDEGAPVDAFGVGTQLGTSGDAPWLGGVYKLVAEKDEPKIKLSTGKVTLPGKKQVHRFYSGDHCERDVVALEEEDIGGGRPVLVEVVRDGRRSVEEKETLAGERRTAETSRQELASLMVGQDVKMPEPRPASPGKPLLVFENVSTGPRPGGSRLDNVSLELRAGAITGLAGVSGNGQGAIAALIAGAAVIEWADFRRPQYFYRPAHGTTY